MKIRLIAHIDLDAFFAAVEQRDNPSLRGKPVVIGADPRGGQGRGVVSTASYEARKYGIHSAMPISTAYKRCPHAVFLPVNGEKYSRVSRQVFAILEEFTPHIQPVSIDEAFMDLSGSFHLFGGELAAARRLKERIRQETGLTASVGMAPVKYVAKIASDYNKPDGLLWVQEQDMLEFLHGLDIGKLWGVGPKTKEALQQKKIFTVKDLARISLDDMVKAFGQHGAHLYNLAHGIDPREVVDDDGIKSVSHEHTFDQDTSDRDELEKVLLVLSEKTSRRLRRHELKGKTVTVKIRLQGFKTYTRARTLPEKTNFCDTIFRTAKDIFREFSPQQPVRLLGVRVSNFEEEYVQESLFSKDADEKNEKIHQVIDLIKDKFGEKAIHRAF